MTEKPRKQSVSALVAEIIYQRFEDFKRETDAYAPTADAQRQVTERLFKEAKTPLDRQLLSHQLYSQAIDTGQRYTTLWLLNLIAMVAEALDMMTKEPKATQAEQDELKARVEAAMKDFDEHIAERMARLFDSSGHEAMYGAGSAQTHPD